MFPSSFKYADIPEISRFFGIIIKMFFHDHVPPHFHAEFGEYRAMISIASGEVIEGAMPSRQLKLIQAWAILHEEELLDNFNGLRTLPAKWHVIAPLK